ncbi:protein of unknown function [Hyphomicrobium sp. MC1]|nr:protein of unknown function [Hyphomicrobium sp. MC1]
MLKNNVGIFYFAIGYRDLTVEHRDLTEGSKSTSFYGVEYYHC